MSEKRRREGEALMRSREFQRQQLRSPEDDELKRAKSLAKKKSIPIKNETFKPGNAKCSSCKKDLAEASSIWFREEIMYLEDPMIKYWFIWSGELRPVAYSAMVPKKKFTCTKCFREHESERACSRAGREDQESVDSVAKKVLVMMKNPASDLS